MASAVIHLAIAKKLEKSLNIKNQKDYYLGSIAPDIAKIIGEDKSRSHFSTLGSNIPNLDLFKKEYPDFKKRDFDIGYYIHLYSDYLWFTSFINNLTGEEIIKCLDGTSVMMSQEEIVNLIYHDYSNLNTLLLDEYNMDLSLFYEDFIIPDSKIEEIPLDKLNILIDKMGVIIENSKEEKNYIFDIYSINNFIDNVVSEIKNELENQ